MIVYKIVGGPDKNHTSVHPYLTTSSVSQKDFSAFRTAHSTSKLVDSSFWKVSQAARRVCEQFPKQSELEKRRMIFVRPSLQIPTKIDRLYT